MNFSWAMDLDPKGANNQIKEAIDKRYVTEDDDPGGMNTSCIYKSALYTTMLTGVQQYPIPTVQTIIT